MSTHTYQLTRGFFDKSLRASTVVDLGFDRRELRIETSKGSCGIDTRATVVQVSEDGKSATYALNYGGGGDFSVKLGTPLAKPATEKNIRAQHEQSIADLAPTIAAAMAYYKQAVAA